MIIPAAKATIAKAETMIPCINLDYEEKYIGCEIKTCEPHFPDVKYWQRNNLPYKGAPVKVQFCKKYGRINEVFACYNVGEMSCHEQAQPDSQ